MRINFLHGLDDDIREQAMHDWWKDNRNFIIFAVFILFASFGATQYYKQHKEQTIQQQAIAFYEAKQAKSSEGFSDLAEDANGGYRAMALFELAQAQMNEGKTAEAAETYAQIRESDASVLIRDLGAVLEAQILMSSDIEASNEKLKALVSSKSPYMLTALELLAVNAQNQEDYATAQNFYQELLAQGGMAEAMRDRVEKRLTYLKGLGVLAANTTEGATN